MDTIEVACGLVYRDGKVLICRRSLNKFLGGFWEFPGGKVEKGEPHEACVKRELMEELNMNVDVGRLFKSITYDYHDFRVHMHAYVCHLNSSSYDLKDHDMYAWVETKNLLAWKLAPADIPIAQYLIALKSN